MIPPVFEKIAPGPEGGRPRGYLDYGINSEGSQAIFNIWGLNSGNIYEVSEDLLRVR
jgi:hypothetical protein